MHLASKSYILGFRTSSGGNFQNYFSFLSRRLTTTTFEISEENNKNHRDIPLIYVVTPTYYRLTQRADMTRLANTLQLVKRLHWIVIEDFDEINMNIQEILNSSHIPFTYFAQKKIKTTKGHYRGLDQRNAALDWIMKNHNPELPAVIYFADDDNAYSLEIFEQVFK